MKLKFSLIIFPLLVGCARESLTSKKQPAIENLCKTQKSKIEVVPYDIRWPEMFEEEKSVILKSLNENCQAIYHIGSTSVPGLSAKPIVDIIVIAKDRKKSIINLEKAGYSYKGEWNIPFKCGFTKKKPYSVNLHVFFDPNHPEIELNLKFRDYLRVNSDACNKYTAIKMQILQDKTSQQEVGKFSFPIYTLRKGKFINNVLKNIGFNRLRILKCLTEDEWKKVKKFHKNYYFDQQKIKDTYHWSFNHQDHEHFILYRGVEIIGYVHIKFLPESNSTFRIIILKEKDQNLYTYFSCIIEKWLKLHNYRNPAERKLI